MRQNVNGSGRPARAAGLLLASIVLVTGCVDARNKAPGKKTEPADDAPAETTPAQRRASKDIMQALTDGTISPDMLTGEFKKQLTKAYSDEDKKTGFSTLDVKNFLSRFEKASFEEIKEDKLGSATGFRGRIKKESKVEAFSMRLVKEANGFKIDWLHKSERQCALPAVPGDADLALAYDTARNFLDTMLGGDLTQSHSLMAPAWRKALAPPSDSDTKKGLDFDPGFLTQTTRFWKGDFVGYSIAKADLGANKDTATFAIDMEVAGRKVPYAIKATRDKASGYWVIEAFEKS